MNPKRSLKSPYSALIQIETEAADFEALAAAFVLSGVDAGFAVTVMLV